MRNIVVPYERFSSSAQADGDSLRRQSEAHRTFIEKHGYTLDTDLSFIDRGISGYTGKNIEGGDLGRILRMLEEGTFPEPHKRILLVEKFDRLSRLKPTDAITKIIKPILAKGLAIATVKEQNIITNDNIDAPENIYPLIALLSQAHAYVEMLQYHVKKSYDGKFQRLIEHGEIMGHQLPAWLKYINNKTAIDVIPEKSATVELIFNMALNGHTSNQICKYLNDHGIPTIAKSNEWSTIIISKMLRNSSVTGLYTSKSKSREGITRENYFPVVVSTEDFNVVQMMMDSRKHRTSSKGGLTKNIFSGLLKCSKCGGGLSFKSADRGTQSKYSLACNSRNTKKKCQCRTIQYFVFEKAVLSHIKQLDLNKILKDETTIDKTAMLQTELHKKKNRLEQLNQFLETNVSDSILRAVVTTEQDIKKIISDLKVEECKIVSIPNFESVDLDSILLECELKRKTPDWDARKRIHTNLRMIIDRIVIDDEKVKNMPRMHEIHFKNGAKEIIVTMGNNLKQAGSIYIEDEKDTVFIKDNSKPDYDYIHMLENL